MQNNNYIKAKELWLHLLMALVSFGLLFAFFFFPALTLSTNQVSLHSK